MSVALGLQRRGVHCHAAVLRCTMAQLSEVVVGGTVLEIQLLAALVGFFV